MVPAGREKEGPPTPALNPRETPRLSEGTAGLLGSKTDWSEVTTCMGMTSILSAVSGVLTYAALSLSQSQFV